MKTNKKLFKFLLLFFVSLASLHSCKEDEIIDTIGIHEYVDSEYATIAKNWYDSNSKLSKNNELDFNKLNVEWTDYKVSPLGSKNKLITVPISSKKDKFYREIAIILSENNPPFGVIKEYTGDPFKENTFLNIYSGSGRHLESAIYNKEDGTMQYISRLKSSKSLKSSMRKIANASGNMNDGFEIEEVVVTGYQPPRDYVYIPPIEYPSYDNPDDNYSVPSSPGGGGGSSSSSAPPTKAKLEEKIKNKPFGLLKDVPCELIQQWVDLGKHLASQGQLDKLNSIIGSRVNPSPDNNFTGKEIAQIQSINSALSTTVNMDYYSVDINKLPENFSSPEQFLHHLRTNINDFVFSYFAEFEAYKWYGINDNNLWNSSNPLNSIIAIDIQGPDNGSVIVTKSDPNKWIFTTIKEPHYGTHPVSGNREFGFIKNANGSYTFYTKGIDRLTNAGGTLAQMASDILRANLSPYERTDKLWKSFQYQIEHYVNKNGGKAIQNTPFAKHPDWKAIKEVIDGKRNISYLNSEC